jgi:hypothetical protein
LDIVFYLLSEYKKMNFGAMSSSFSLSNYPAIKDNDPIVVTTSQEINIPSNQPVQIYMGLILTGLPKNHIVKIYNPHHRKNVTMITQFWLPSSNELSLTLMSKNPLHIKIGEHLCHLQAIPIRMFLPGNLPTP